jgi:alkylresorcinol/alkylpyrone synthase
MSTITSIATTLPAFSATQAELKATFRPLFALDGRRLDAAMALFDHAEVETRHSVLSLPEFARPRTLTETMKVYAQNARELGQRVGRACLARAREDATSVDLIITVSCTGIMIPSLDAFLIETLGLRRDVRRLPITELGCVGGAAAVARANDYLRGHPGGRVLVISVELPSLSLQPGDVSPDHLVSSAIFGDGAAALLIVGDGVRPADGSAGPGDRGVGRVRIMETLSHTIAASTHALGFDLHEDGFHPVLAKDVPRLLRAEVRGLVERLTQSAGVTPGELGAYILHPGGKKVLGAVEEALGLSRPETQPSWDVLRDYGNQSSASVLFVLERWMTARQPAAGTLGVMAAFGPGLTAEALLLKWI